MSESLKALQEVLEKLSVFNDREHGNEHFINGIETAIEVIEQVMEKYEK